MILKNELKQTDYDLLIFDIGGTLLYYHDLDQLLEETFKYFGIPYKKCYEEYKDNAIMDIVVQARTKKCFSFENLSTVIGRYMPFLSEYGINEQDICKQFLSLEPNYTFVFPNVEETIKQLKFFRMVCSSNWLKSVQEEKLKNANILENIQKIYTCEELYAKPNIKHFIEILERENVSPEKTLVVGNSYSDLCAGIIGIQTVLVDYDLSKKRFYESTDAVVNDFSDVSKLILK